MFVIQVQLFVFHVDQKIKHAFDMKMAGKRFDLEETTFDNILFLMKTYISAIFEPRACRLLVLDRSFTHCATEIDNTFW